MTDQGLILTLVDSLVAIGTLALAVITVYQLRLFIRERRSSQARELADRIYTPLRTEVASWVVPEQVFGGASAKTWIELKEKAPYLTLRIPRDLMEMLDAAQGLLVRIGFLDLQVRGMIHDETSRLTMELCARAKVTFHGLPMIRVLGRRELITQVDIGMVWCSKMPVKDWVDKYVKDHYPVASWEVEVLNGSDRLGGLDEADAMAREVFAFLSKQTFAQELLEKIYEVKELAQKAILRIEDELSKPVAPWE